MLLAIAVGFIIVSILIFIAFWIPSECAKLGEGVSAVNHVFDLKMYFGVIIITTLVLLGAHLLLEGAAYISRSDIPIYLASLMAVTPTARKIYKAMKVIILGR